MSAYWEKGRLKRFSDDLFQFVSGGCGYIVNTLAAISLRLLCLVRFDVLMFRYR